MSETSVHGRLLDNLRLIALFDPATNLPTNPRYLRKNTKDEVILQRGKAQLDWKLIMTALEPIHPEVRESLRSYQDVLKQHMHGRNRKRGEEQPQPQQQHPQQPNYDIFQYFTAPQIEIVNAVVQMHTTQLREEFTLQIQALRAEMLPSSNLNDDIVGFGDDILQ